MTTDSMGCAKEGRAMSTEEAVNRFDSSCDPCDCPNYTTCERLVAIKALDCCKGPYKGGATEHHICPPVSATVKKCGGCVLQYQGG
jgi:hypothetical protein